MPGELRPHQLPQDTTIAADDAVMVDGPTRGTRRLTPFAAATEILRYGGDSVYLRAEVVNALIAALNGRLSIAEINALTATNAAGIAEARSAEAEDAATAAQTMAQAAIAAANGFQVEDYLGEIGTLDANPGLAASLVGKWWTVTVEGTLTHVSVAGLAVKPGDRILSNGTAWLRWVLAPAFLTAGSVERYMLSKFLRDCLTPLDHPDYAFSITDSLRRLGPAVGHDGRLHAIIAHKPGSVPTAALADASVTQAKLAPEVAQGILLPLQTPGWTFALMDSAGKSAIACRDNGNLVGRWEHRDGSIATAALADGAVTWEKLAPSVQAGVPSALSGLYEERAVWCDEAGKVAMRIYDDGSVQISRLRLGLGAVSGLSITTASVPADRLDAPLRRAVLSTPADTVTDDHDRLRRGAAVTVTAGTDPQSGELSTRFPYFRTPVLYGVNNSGTALELSRAPFFVLRGTQDRGTWAAGAVAPASVADEGDWWTATGSGSFEGVAYTAGDRIVCIGSTRQSATITPRYVKAKAGEFYHRGEFTPASFTPSSPADGDHWVADANGTFSGMTFSTGDSLLRVGGAWLPVPREDMKTVAAGAAWSYRVSNAEEIQVRRADKSATAVNVPATAYTLQVQRRTSDGIIFRGDSMVATGGLHTELASLLAPRQVTAFSWAAANSEQVLTSVLRDIAAGDPYRGWFHLWFMGTNDSYDLPKISRGALRASRLSGAADGRCLFLTPIGQWTMSWNGSRIVHFDQEQITAGTHAASAVNRWFASVFPGRHINTLAALIAGASDTTPSLHHPGLTEKVAAQTYGAAPTSAFYNFAALPFQPGQITFTGYRSAAGLPTGGTDGDYQIRTGNGSIGLLIVRWAGTWVEYPVDITHLSPAGNRILAAAVASFLTTNSL